MSYKFIGDEKDIELLTELGYKDLYSDREIQVDSDCRYQGSVDFSGTKVFDKDKVAVWFINDGRPIEVYRYDGDRNKHIVVGELSDDEALPYIQDLIDENLIRKVGK